MGLVCQENIGHEMRGAVLMNNKRAVIPRSNCVYFGLKSYIFVDVYDLLTSKDVQL